MKCQELPINSKLLERLHEYGFTDLTTIQEKCIPHVLNGSDVVGQAETGSGKTLAFCLPILDKINCHHGLQALVLTPTRELCIQLSDVFKDFGKALHLTVACVHGGVSIGPQIQRLKSAEITVATPGRMLDHIRRGTIDLRHIQVIVIDETDKMFEMGFVEDVEAIVREAPRDRQLLLFSATISDDVLTLVQNHTKEDPVVIRTQSYVDHTKLHQVYYDIGEQNRKFSLLVHLLKTRTEGLSIVFCGTRRESDVVARNLKNQGIYASAIHGGMNQNKRMISLNDLKNERTKVLVATDVAARGLDIKNITHIYNYDVPKTPIEYIHRIGRTARAGAKGSAITLLTERDHENFRRVQSNEDLRIEQEDMPQFQQVPFRRHTEQQPQQHRGGMRPHQRNNHRPSSFSSMSYGRPSRRY